MGRAACAVRVPRGTWFSLRPGTLEVGSVCAIPALTRADHLPDTFMPTKQPASDPGEQSRRGVSARAHVSVVTDDAECRDHCLQGQHL